jgi:hypothetical protein
MLASMKKPRAVQPHPQAPPASAPSKPVPELPAWKAFVVQFSREAGTEAGIFAGRVEHLSSGRRARFSSAEELVLVLRQQLEQLGAVADVHESED